MADSLILMVLALVVFGPRRLPQIGRQIGKLMYEFRKASNDFKFQMEEELRLSEEADRRKKEEEQRKQLGSTQPGQESASATAGIAGALEPPDSSPRPDPTEAGVDAEPKIYPPSTGETVASMRRSEVVELNETPSATEPVTGNVEAKPALGGPHSPQGSEPEARDESSSAVEAARHNG
jgi:sec-independent protein translocase protein TatB